MTDLVQNLKIGNTTYAIQDGNTLPALTAAQRTTLLSNGTYLGKAVENGVKFETDSGKFEQFSKVAGDISLTNIETKSFSSENVTFITPSYNTICAETSSGFHITHDGINWVDASAPSGTSQIVYNGSVYVAVIKPTSSSVSLSYSTDLQNWTSAYSKSSWTPVDSCYCNGHLFILSRTSNTVLESSDGINWNELGLGMGSSNAVYAQGKYIFWTYNSTSTKYSTDLVTFSSGASLPNSLTWRTGCVDGNGMVLFSNSDGRSATSSDITSSVTTLSASQDMSAVGYTNGMYITGHGWESGHTTGVKIGASLDNMTAVSTFANSGITRICTLGNKVFIQQNRESNTTSLKMYVADVDVSYTYSLTPLSYTKSEIDSKGYLQNTATGSNSMSIGGVSSSYGNSMNVGIGSSASGLASTAIGIGAVSNVLLGTAIGRNAVVTANGSIQLGYGTNSTEGTLSVGLATDMATNHYNYELLNSSGKIPLARINTATGEDALTIGGTSTSYRRSVNIGGQSQASGDKSTAVGYSATATQSGSVVLGNGAESTGTLGTAVGQNAKAWASHAIALGANARNSEAQTFKVALNNSWDPATDEASGLYTLLNSSGKVPTGRYIAMTGADGTNAGTIGAVPAPTATDNTKFLRGDGTWQTVSGGSGIDADVDRGLCLSPEGVRGIIVGCTYDATNHTLTTNSTSNAYLQLPDEFFDINNADVTAFEAVVHLHTKAPTSGRWITIMSPNINIGQGSSKIFGSTFTTPTISQETDLWLKIGKSSGTITLSYSTDTTPSSWTTIGTSSAASTTAGKGQWTLGSNLGATTESGVVYYLADCYVSIDGTEVWRGYSASARSTLSSLAMLNMATHGTSVSYPAANSSTYSTAYGVSAEAGINSVAVGFNTKATASQACAVAPFGSAYGFYSTALGGHAIANSTGSIQIGAGTNNSAGTLSVGLSTDGNTFNNYRLLDSSGNIPTGRMGNVYEVVQTMPASPTAGKIYFVTGS